MCKHSYFETVEDQYYDKRLMCRTLKIKRACIFLWQIRKRGGAYERPTEAQTAVFWQVFEVKNGIG